MINYLKIKKEAGVGLIEILVAAAIIGLSLAALAGVGNFALGIQNRIKKTTAASYLAIEAIEATRAIKDEDWTAITAFSAGVPVHPIQGGSPAKWSLAAGNETIDGFSRQIIFANVYRDSNDDIDQVTSIFDANTKKITVTVSWSERGQAQQISLSDYLTNWKPE